MEVVSRRYSYRDNWGKAKRRRARIKKILIVLLVFIAGGAYSYLAISKSLPPLQITELEVYKYNGSKEIEASLFWPKEGQAAIGSVEDGVYAVKDNQNEPAPIASMTKLITSLVVLNDVESGNSSLGDTYVVQEADVQIYDTYVQKLGSVMPVSVGQELTRGQMIQALMLPSANNIADSLVLWTFGSMDNYLDKANQFLRQNHLTDTFVADASGFSPESQSTPMDMIAVGQLVLKSNYMREVVATKEVNIPGSGIIQNTNQLIGEDGVIGIKTGNTDEAGKCLLYAINQGSDDATIIVIMGMSKWQDLYAEARLLKNSMNNYIGKMDIVSTKTVVGRVESAWGESSNLVINEDLTIYGWKARDYETQLVSKTENIHTVRSGQVVADLSIKDTDRSISVSSENSIKGPSIIWRLLHYW